MLTVASLLASAGPGAAVPATSMGEFAAQSVLVAKALLDEASSGAPEQHEQALEALQFGGRIRLVIDAGAGGGVRVRLRVLRSPADPNADELGNFWAFSCEVPLSELFAPGVAGGGGFGARESQVRGLVPGEMAMPSRG